MSPNSIEAFVSLARRDAAMQERVAAALRQSDPVTALLSVSQAAGFNFTATELAASLGHPMGDRALDAVVGGAGAYSGAEWFAEFRRLGPTGQIERD